LQLRVAEYPSEQNKRLVIVFAVSM